MEEGGRKPGAKEYRWSPEAEKARKMGSPQQPPERHTVLKP